MATSTFTQLLSSARRVYVYRMYIRDGVSDSESRRDREERGELDCHEEIRLSFASPGEIKRLEVSWTATKNRRDQEAGGGAGPSGSAAQKRSRARMWSWALRVGLLLQLFLNSSATDIVLVTAPHSS